MSSDSFFTHFNTQGDAHMVNVGDKPLTKRQAIAQGHICMRATTLDLIQNQQSQKGDVLAVARVAAIMACKHTADLIPLCHPLALTHVDVAFSVNSVDSCIVCRVCCETTGATGVEMEALTGVQIGLLTIYDMCKAVDKSMVMQGIHLVEKHGGKSGSFVAAHS